MDYFDKKAERNSKREDAKLDVELARAKAEADVYVKRETSEIDWGLIMAEGSKTSWKDEWFVILWSVPLGMAFIPGMAPYVRQGFDVLDASVPDWFIAGLGVMIAASFGVPKVIDSFKRAKR
jgi:hypothetical protein